MRRDPIHRVSTSAVQHHQIPHPGSTRSRALQCEHRTRLSLHGPGAAPRLLVFGGVVAVRRVGGTHPGEAFLGARAGGLAAVQAAAAILHRRRATGTAARRPGLRPTARGEVRVAARVAVAQRAGALVAGAGSGALTGHGVLPTNYAASSVEVASRRASTSATSRSMSASV